MTRTSRLLSLSLLTLLLGTVNSAQSKPDDDERWFQTEIIVFEIREKSTADFQELWPDDPGLPNYEDRIELNLPVGTTVSEESVEIESAEGSDNATPLTPQTDVSTVEQPFQLLSDETLTLSDIVVKLGSSAKYVPILHIAWRQPMLAKEVAQTIYIHSNLGDTTLELTADLINNDKLLTAPSLTEISRLLAGEGKTIEATPLNTLDGTIKIHLGRYLHLEADLLYRNQTEPLQDSTFFMNFNEGEQAPTLFRMHQKRRMRSGELHYFDHPMFGLLALITPYELPEINVISETAIVPATVTENSGSLDIKEPR